jgi:class 3 adenylate cyclase/alpha-beta hydrolase superfamily lysophospholipase
MARWHDRAVMAGVLEVPETRFARTRTGDHVAYQVLGDGPDLVLIPGWATHVEAMWEEPRLAAFLHEVASFSRLILFDKRGAGLSDPMPGPTRPTLEAWTDDVQVVMDAVGSEQAVVAAAAEAGPMAMLFAAGHPERVTGLVLMGSFATLRRTPDYPAGLPDSLRETVRRRYATSSDGPILLALKGPSLAHDTSFQRWGTRYQRMAASPGGLASMADMILDVDVRPVLANIEAPTRVIHRTDDPCFRIDHGRYLAEAIPDAKLIEVPGRDHYFWIGDTEPLLTELAEVVTGARLAPQPDRVLSTMLFTDIVSSTAQAAAVGDRRWRRILDAHDLMVRRQLGRFRGREVKTTGDGFLATFDGPARAIRCACAIRDAAHELGLEIRAGLHAGEVERRGDDIGGIAVHIASRVEGAAGAGQVLVSGAVPPLVAGSGIDFHDLGEHDLHGAPGQWRLYAVAG